MHTFIDLTRNNKVTNMGQRHTQDFFPFLFLLLKWRAQKSAWAYAHSAPTLCSAHIWLTLYFPITLPLFFLSPKCRVNTISALILATPLNKGKDNYYVSCTFSSPLPSRSILFPSFDVEDTKLFRTFAKKSLTRRFNFF